MIRAHRVAATAQDDASLIGGWNISPNVEYTVALTPGATSCGVFLFAGGGALVASGAALVGTEQPCVLIPQSGQAISMIDAELGWHLMLTTVGTEQQRTIRINPAVDLPDEIHPIYADDALALVRATAGIDASAHYIDELAVSCPLGLGVGLGDVANVPVDGVDVVGQVESLTWTGTPNGASEQAVIRRHVAIAPSPAVAPPAPPVVANDTGATDAATTTSGNVLANDASGLTVTAVNGLSASVGVDVAGNSGGVFTIASNGEWTFNPDGDFSLLTGSETADTSVTYHASDGVSEASATLTITVSSGSAPELWTPAEITTALWLDADDSSTLTLDGSVVDQWADRSGNARHVTASSTIRPAFSSTGLSGALPAVVFDGSNDRLVSAGFGFPRPFSVFFVGNNSGGSYRRAINIGASTDTCGFIGSNAGNYATFFGNGSGTWVDTAANSSAQSVSSPKIFGVTNSGSGSSAAIPYVNSAAQTAKGGGTFSGTGRGVSIGGYSGAAGQEWAGPISEVVILSRVADADERQKIEGYLAHKWNLAGSLPSGHPYKSAPPYVE